MFLSEHDKEKSKLIDHWLTTTKSDIQSCVKRLRSFSEPLIAPETAVSQASILRESAISMLNLRTDD